MSNNKFFNLLFIVFTFLASLSANVRAELSEISLAKQYGDSYLPLMMMERYGLIEKHALGLGLGKVAVTWSTVSGGAAANDALLSGNLHFVSGGLGPLLQVWGASGGRIKGVAALNSMPLLLNTNNPNVKSIRDFSDKDRIAVPAVRVSMQAVVLRMAAAKEFGEKNFDQLDKLTVTMTQADATAAIMTGATGITSHFGNSPFQFQQLQDAKVRTVLNSFDVLGGPQTFGVVWTTSKFREDNPTLYKAVLAALSEAVDAINADKKAAAELYVTMSRSKTPVEFVHKILTNPQVGYSLTPTNSLKLAQFMHKVGQIKLEPKAWKDYFFPEIHALPGS